MSHEPSSLGEIAYLAFRRAAVDFGLGPVGEDAAITPWAELDAVTRASWNASAAAVAAELAPRQGAMALQAITAAHLAVKNIAVNGEREIELALVQLEAAWQWVQKALKKPPSQRPTKKEEGEP